LEEWKRNIVDDGEAARELIAAARRVAVIGIKTEAAAGQPAYYVPEYLHGAGVTVVPVPVYYPDATEILGEPVYRALGDVPGPIDMVILFRRSADVAKHVDEIIAAKPDSAWLQLGIRNDAAAERLARAGIRVVQDRCSMVDHRSARTRRRNGL
jgi:uncharacterized protein